MPAREAPSAAHANEGRRATEPQSAHERHWADATRGAGPVKVKICGVGSQTDIDAAAGAGARYVGFNFYPPSPRAIPVDKAARLAASVPQGIDRVALFVDPDNSTLDAVLARVAVEHVQLHGGESPARGLEIRERTGKAVIRAVRLREADDLAAIREAEGWADQILCDALPTASGMLPGGNGISFDWRLIQDREWSRPWILAGGLTPENVCTAMRLTGACQVDVSSGVEAGPGRKDPERIRAFLRKAGARPQAPSGSTP